VLANVVVVHCLLEEPPRFDERVDGRGRGIGPAEERLPVDLADDPPLGLDHRVGADHLQVEHEPARPDCFDHVAQDVHDVLRLDSSERPGEDDEIERVRRDLDLLPRRDLVADTIGELGRERTARSVDRLGLRVERVHVRGVLGHPDRESTVAATHFENATLPEVAEPAEGGEVGAFRVEHGTHRTSSLSRRLCRDVNDDQASSQCVRGPRIS
jgi:hypothetical protein